jgi:hypothetical protein
LSEGDAQTHFFHAYANSRMRRNHIHELEHDGRVITEEQEKADLIFNYLDGILGMVAIHSNAINMQALGLPMPSLQELGERFTEDEILRVIRSLPRDKALGPDGFTARFLQASWEIIRPDVMRAFDVLWHLDMHDVHCVNDALLVLLLKSAEARLVKDY